MKRGEKIPINVSGPSNPPDGLAQHVWKKSLTHELFLILHSEVQNLTVFAAIIYMIRIRFCGPGELIQKGFQAAQYLNNRPRVRILVQIARNAVPT